MSQGISISDKHGSNIDWARIAARRNPQITHVLVRATEGGPGREPGYVDRKVQDHMVAARSAGLAVSTTHTAARLWADPEKQARHYAPFFFNSGGQGRAVLRLDGDDQPDAGYTYLVQFILRYYKQLPPVPALLVADHYMAAQLARAAELDKRDLSHIPVLTVEPTTDAQPPTVKSPQTARTIREITGRRHGFTQVWGQIWAENARIREVTRALERFTIFPRQTEV